MRACQKKIRAYVRASPKKSATWCSPMRSRAVAYAKQYLLEVWEKCPTLRSELDQPSPERWSL